MSSKPKYSGMKPGRKSTYDDSYPDKLIKHMSQGHSFETFGAVIGRGRRTLYDWVDEHEEFAEAKAIGDVLSEHWWWKKGMEHMVTYDKDVKFNAAVWIFTMKCRFGHRDGSENARGKEKEEAPPSNEEIQKILDLVEARKKRGA